MTEKQLIDIMAKTKPFQGYYSLSVRFFLIFALN